MVGRVNTLWGLVYVYYTQWSSVDTYCHPHAGLSHEMSDPLVYTDVFVCLRPVYVVQIICVNMYGTVRE